MGHILIIAAVVPAIWLLVKVYNEDRMERESSTLLVRLVLSGIFSTVLAMVGERIGSYIMAMFFDERSLIYNLLFYFIVVGVSEEGAKYLLLRYRTWQSPEFNCTFDGVVYAVFVSLGFALWENIGYVMSYGLGTALIRAITAIPGHACFGVFMGVWYGAAKRSEMYGNIALSAVQRKMALIIPILLHGCYDFIATVDNSAYSVVFIVFVAAMFFAAYRAVKKASRNDEYI